VLIQFSFDNELHCFSLSGGLFVLHANDSISTTFLIVLFCGGLKLIPTIENNTINIRKIITTFKTDTPFAPKNLYVSVCVNHPKNDCDPDEEDDTDEEEKDEYPSKEKRNSKIMIKKKE